MQHENLPPAGYVQALPTITHGVMLSDDVPTFTLESGYPAIVRALNLIREDNGGPSWPPEATPEIGLRWHDDLATIEAALASLADDKPALEDTEAAEHIAEDGWCYIYSELYTFCNGEDTVMQAIADRTPELRMASDFLSDFFDGWAHPTEETPNAG